LLVTTNNVQLQHQLQPPPLATAQWLQPTALTTLAVSNINNDEPKVCFLFYIYCFLTLVLIHLQID
jgi:hypothetical protein